MLRITITRAGILAIGKKGFRDAGRAAIEAVGRYWWAKYLPLHYKNIAYLRYNYTPRDNRTKEMKRERKMWPFGEHREKALGEQLPHVWSGRSRERALSTEKVRPKATSFEKYHVDVIIDAPAYNFSAGKRIDLRKEVTTLSTQEEKTLEQVFTREFNSQLRAQGLKAPRVTRRTAA